VSIGITLIGLGMSPADLTAGAEEALEKAGEIILLDPLPPGYVQERFTYQALGDLCGAAEGAAGVEECANALLKLGIRAEGVVLAVSGDPTCSSALITALRKKAEGVSIPVRIFPASGCLQYCLALAGIDAGEGLFQINAAGLAGRHHPPFSPDSHVFLQRLPDGAALDSLVAVLEHQYPREHRVSLFYRSADGYQRREMALDALPSRSKPDHPIALLIPPLKAESSLENFQETIAHLRADDGCPWDRKQTHQSLRIHLLEETYEALDALDKGDLHALREELGDILLQIALHAQIATESGTFRMADVIAGIQKKIIYRHPHVFSDVQADDVDKVLQNWEALKQEERHAEGADESLLNGVPTSLPALAQAVEIQTRAARVGFDWDTTDGVLDKIQEEVEEIRAARTESERSAELGDLLFVLSNYARWLNIEPESALREASIRFRRRFNAMEAIVRARGRELRDLSLAEMDAIWDEVKARE